MRRIVLLSVIVAVVCAAGCMRKPLPPVAVDILPRPVDYLTEVKPLLDKRCVVCHSCYNSPCQLKLSSYEGLDRGATKEAVYSASRLQTMDPTRLFTDGETTEQWRDKGFFSVTSSSIHGGANDSIMLQLLAHKMKNPQSVGEFYPEASDLTCAEDGKELSGYLDKHPNNGMPFGFPPLEDHEFTLIASWLAQGAHGPSAEERKTRVSVAVEDLDDVARWEAFLNSRDAKSVMTARYLYEHLFLAHINFAQQRESFYELVRSRTGPGENIEILPTRRPYDDPGGPFYYRFRRIHSTIVYKTHMVFTLDRQMYSRVNELFIRPDWLQQPHVMGYDEKASADPFMTFEQIPPRSRYQFLLDNAHYIIMTFIRGPVCKGQVALNVINDHFWVLFLDPEADLAVRYPAFLNLHRSKLRMPAEKGSDSTLLKAIGNPYHDRAMGYHRVRQEFYMVHNYNGMGYDAIWKGEKPGDSPLLTIFRHFDSASVHRGPLGDLPRTVWVIDYPLFERIYYSLVAGFDVFGSAWHQLATRLYMDALRREGESNFLDFMPREQRREMLEEWYRGMDLFHVRYHPTTMESGVPYETASPKREFVENLVTEHFARDLGLHFDGRNTHNGDHPEIPAEIRDSDDVMLALHAATAPGASFFTKVTDHNANLAFIRVKMRDGNDMVISVVIHRWHDNVTFLFGEGNTLRPELDSADFFEGFIGAYPNYFFVVDIDDFREFALLLRDYTRQQENVDRLAKFGINRNDPAFWQVYDWFQQEFLRADPVKAGLFDLNRYYFKGI